jgi:hypothetical protein
MENASANADSISAAVNQCMSRVAQSKTPRVELPTARIALTPE